MIATMPCGNVSSEMFVELYNSISKTVSQMTTHGRKQTLYYGAILVVYLFWPSGQRQGKTSPQQRRAETESEQKHPFIQMQ